VLREHVRRGGEAARLAARSDRDRDAGRRVTALSARDRKAALHVLQAAQVAYALSRFPKKQVLDGADDQKRLRDSITATRAAAADLSAALRDRTDIKWQDLIAGADDDEAAWRIAKRVIP